MSRINFALLAGITVFVHSLLAGGAPTTSVLTNVPEAANYTLAYELSIPNGADYTAGPVPYSIDNTASIGEFSRIAYYLELQQGDGGLQWIYASFAAPANITQANQTGVPTVGSGEFYNYGNTPIANMNVLSNVAGIVTGTGISTGSIEFWPNDYFPTNGYGVPNANGDNYDFGDTAAFDGAFYGSMQLANYGASQTLFAYNNWNNGGFISDLGIGNAPGTNSDWTFAGNADAYNIKTMDIFVLAAPEPSSALLGGTAVLMLWWVFRRRYRRT